jgi:hypothetical protein
MNATQQTVSAAQNLQGLCNVLNDFESDDGEILDNVVDLPGLPTFGGVDPSDTRDVWSWDADSVLLWDGRYYIARRDPDAWYDRRNK